MRIFKNLNFVLTRGGLIRKWLAYMNVDVEYRICRLLLSRTYLRTSTNQRTRQDFSAETVLSFTGVHDDGHYNRR